MKKGELTRQHIIETAAPVFNQRGFAGCSMQDVMEATGLEKGGLYRHFASKEELAVEAFKYAMERAISERVGDLDQISGAIPRLRHVVRAFVEIPSPVPGGCPLMHAAADADSTSGRVKEQARKALGAWKARLCAILDEGIATGELRREINPRKTANVIVAMLEGAHVISRLEGTKQAMLDAQESLIGLLEGLSPGRASFAKH